MPLIRPAYFQTFGSLLREEEAQLLWRGSLQALHSGRSQDEIGDVALIEFGGRLRRGPDADQQCLPGAY